MKNPYQRQSSFVYGDHTQGRVYKDLETEFVSKDGTSEDNALKHITLTLDTFKISPEQLKEMTVLDIGTGRHSLRFHHLGAKEIIHFDISKSHIEQTQRYCKEKGITTITSIQGDLSEDLLPTEKFDLIYAAGIFQHLNPPSKGLVNWAQSLKVGGHMYHGFYRSGEWRWFISALIRKGVEASSFANIKSHIAVTFGLGNMEHFQVSRMIDDFYTPQQNCFHPNQILHDHALLGLEPVEIDPDRRDYNHEGGEYFTIGADRIFARKVKPTDVNAAPLQTQHGIDQLTGIEYKEPIIYENIELWYELINMYKHGFIPTEIWNAVLINLYRFTRPWEAKYDAYYVYGKEDGRHKTLNAFLTNLARTFSQ